MIQDKTVQHYGIACFMHPTASVSLRKLDGEFWPSWKCSEGCVLFIPAMNRPNWCGPFPPNVKLGNLTEALKIKVLYNGRVQIDVMGHKVSGLDLQDALAQAFQVVALEQYTKGRTAGYEKGYSEARD